jgi:hypothetical protein
MEAYLDRDERLENLDHANGDKLITWYMAFTKRISKAVLIGYG